LRLPAFPAFPNCYDRLPTRIIRALETWLPFQILRFDIDQALDWHPFGVRRRGFAKIVG
jgi:hypothetical protein